MALEGGTRLGGYEIVAQLGAGGMGEVYRARDPQLDRDVAIKVLPSGVTDPEALARFDREAKILASLNHPHIATIHGLIDENGRRALVLELVQGETLAAILRRGPMPLKQTLAVARQISEALEAAHEKGVVHRDLKPGNVMVTPAGEVKVLDFGLAAFVQAKPAAAVGAEAPTLTVSPTIVGTIMGTASYMSPEQAEGLVVDRRADIWSYGVVLWEMLTGKRLFDAASVSRTLADVLRADIDFTQLPAATPPGLVHLLRRCLDRETINRLRDIGEARVAIDSSGRATTEPAPRQTPSRAWIAATALFAAALGAVAFVHWREQPAVQESYRFQIPLPPGTTLRHLAVSPNGRHLAYVVEPVGTSMTHGTLYIRDLDALGARLIPGAKQVMAAFWSPDSQQVAYGSGMNLVKIDRNGVARPDTSLTL